MPIVGLERVVFYRERASATYNPWAFGITMAAVEIPYVIAQVSVRRSERSHTCDKG